MSSSAVLAPAPPAAASPRSPSDDACIVSSPPARPPRSERSIGKGRRRRAVAEQRRAEQQHWSNFSDDRDEDIYVAPPRVVASRRQLRRAARRSHEDWEVSFQEEFDDNLEFALALSLSLSETPADGSQLEERVPLLENRPLDMSYESLVMLENVKCTAPSSLITQMIGHVYEKEVSCSQSNFIEKFCTICQIDFKDKDLYMVLPCSHTFHEACGSEWFLNHSKLCPVCKHDITENI